MITEFVDVFVFILSLTGFEAVLKCQELLNSMENGDQREATTKNQLVRILDLAYELQKATEELYLNEVIKTCHLKNKNASYVFLEMTFVMIFFTEFCLVFGKQLWPSSIS